MQAVIKPVRLNNVCQILARTVGVSSLTLRVVDVVGGEDDHNRNMILRGMEVKARPRGTSRDIASRSHHH